MMIQLVWSVKRKVYLPPNGVGYLFSYSFSLKIQKYKQAIYSNLQTFDTFLVQTIYKYGTILM